MRGLKGRETVTAGVGAEFQSAAGFSGEEILWGGFDIAWGTW